MFLKTLSIRGFKSFADRAVLELEPGITVVVGPNGSGKSNVVDAIAWVLGAQAPSTIRSQKMDDVIFAGTSGRPALGRAEVALTIDNAAGLLPIDFSEVTITRTLFRSGESEYAINGVGCRLLDIQELLSDAGVGRNQHVIVSQGQIDAVLNARPEERRSIIEEAAGILKYRKRRERAEKRLNATEADLQRVNDLQREIRRQLRPLEKQALAAERHVQLAAELGALQRYVAGQELAGLRFRVDAVSTRRREAEGRATQLAAGLVSLDAEIVEGEQELRVQGGRSVGDLLARYETARERARGLEAVLVERRRGLERVLALRADDDPVAALEGEQADVATAMETLRAELDEAGPLRDEAAALEAKIVADRAALVAPVGDGPDPLAARAVEVRRELAALRSGSDRSAGELGRLRDRRTGLERRAGQVTSEAGIGEDALDETGMVAAGLADAIETARTARTVAEDEAMAAEEALRDAEGERRAWQARAEALGQALSAARSRAGAQRLGTLDGVVGTLLDVVDIDPGWERAFESAAGEALGAVVVRGIDTARAGLSRLAADGGAVLPVLDRSDRADDAAAALLPTVGEPVRGHVRGRTAEVDALLDRLLARAVRVEGSWEDALDVAVGEDGAADLILVTDDGDRFGATGWRVGTASAGVTGAMVEDATARASFAAERVGPARARLDAARAGAKVVRTQHEQTVRAADEHRARQRAAVVSQERARKAAADIAAEMQQVEAQMTAIEQRIAQEGTRVVELEGQLPALEAAERDEAARAEAKATAEADLDGRRSEASRRRMELEVRVAQLNQRHQLLGDRARDLVRRLDASRRSREEAAAERDRARDRLVVVGRLASVVERQERVIVETLTELQAERQRLGAVARQIGQRLDGVRQQRATTESRLGEQRDIATRAEVELAELGVRIEALCDRIRRELDLEPEVTLDAERPEVPEGITPVARARDLERELRQLGPVNPLAVEEYRTLQERHELIETQVADVRNSRRELQKVIRAIDEEIMSTFAAAFADVAGHFEHLFATLFPGGTGSLRLTTPDDLLNTGVEVEARPSGKNVRKLSLLSGGERSLTALGLLFAIFRSRPSPFYVMDEVEAALDDINLRRFLDLLEEFRGEAQLIVVSHQKRTMEIADCLYGVTMKPGDSSRVVSEKLRAS